MSIRVFETSPGRLVLSKNGRAVSAASALGMLAKLYPGVEWVVTVGDHRTIARRKP